MCLTFLNSLDAANSKFDVQPDLPIESTPRSLSEDVQQHLASSMAVADSVMPGVPSAADANASLEADEAFESKLAITAEGSAAAAAETEVAVAEAAQALVETLLDVYDARLNSLCDQIEQLASTIENTQVPESRRPGPSPPRIALLVTHRGCDASQDVLELTLDNERNRIARLELLLSMAGLSVGTCSAVSGFFGMNLLSGLEATAGLFALVTGISILLTGSLFVTCCMPARVLRYELVRHRARGI